MPTDDVDCFGADGGAVYLKGSYSSSSCSQGAESFPEGGGGGAALGMSTDEREFLVLGGGCEGKGGGIARGAETEGRGGGERAGARVEL